MIIRLKDCKPRTKAEEAIELPNGDMFTVRRLTFGESQDLTKIMGLEIDPSNPENVRISSDKMCDVLGYFLHTACIKAVIDGEEIECHAEDTQEDWIGFVRDMDQADGTALLTAMNQVQQVKAQDEKEVAETGFRDQMGNSPDS